MRVKILEKEEIYFENYYLENEFESRNSSTSYLNEFKIKSGNVFVNSDFKFRLICYKNLLEIIKGNYKSNFDIFGGIGITAKLFSGEGVETYVNDIDSKCISILLNNFKNVFNFDAFNLESELTFDLIVSDYNDFTISKYLKDEKYYNSLRNLFKHSNKYVIINDCSVFYLKYGKKSFEVYSKLFSKEITNFEELILAEKEYFELKFPDWKVSAVEYFTNSSFILFEKTNKSEFNINRVLNNDEKIIEIEL